MVMKLFNRGSSRRIRARHALVSSSDDMVFRAKAAAASARVQYSGGPVGILARLAAALAPASRPRLEMLLFESFINARYDSKDYRGRTVRRSVLRPFHRI